MNRSPSVIPSTPTGCTLCETLPCAVCVVISPLLCGDKNCSLSLHGNSHWEWDKKGKFWAQIGYFVLYIQRGAFIMRLIFSQKTQHSSPVRASYGVSFVEPSSDWYSALVRVIIYVISCNIGPHYNGIRLYITVRYESLKNHEICGGLKWYSV